MKLAYFSLALILLLGACDQKADEDNAAGAAVSETSDTDTAASDDSQPTQRYTKDDFEELVLGKTKAEVRAQFGSPNHVSGSDEWDYLHLPVYDKDAGTEVGTTTIQFGLPDTLALQLYKKQCADQDWTKDDCANNVIFN
jgi:outer membrane protein assembly factor BamE (lipoprotein component of BamABCDE complex)